jgi:hypothetical protein
VVFGKDGKWISFKNRLKGHINWRKVKHFNVIRGEVSCQISPSFI